MPDLGREVVVAGGTRDQDAKAGVGEARPGILDHRLHDVAVAAFHQDVGDRLAQRFALRDGEQMLLALARGIGDERAVIEPFRLRQYRPRHLDVVVEGEHGHHVDRGVGDRRQPVRKLGARLGLDGVHEARHDVVEQADLVLRITRRAADEEIGDAGQHLDPARVGAGGERGFEFVEEGEGSHVAPGRRHAL